MIGYSFIIMYAWVGGDGDDELPTDEVDQDGVWVGWFASFAVKLD